MDMMSPEGGEDYMKEYPHKELDTWETDELKWGNTTAQAFYLDNEYCNTEYNIYLKCNFFV